MIEYKRLTAEKVKGTTARYLRIDKNYICSTYDIITEEKYEFVDMILNRLAELEDKIENGTLTETPCKVGTRIWVILGNNIFGRKVKSIVIRGDGYTIKTSNTNGWKDLEPYYSEEFGVKWFLTKVEAEKKLKG